MPDKTTWKPIKDGPTNGKDVWLGWNPFTGGSGVIPRRGHWDCGTKQWICQWEDHGDADGHRPMPFDPQPNFYCEGYEPDPPTNLDTVVLMPFIPTPVMWSGLARDILNWSNSTGRTGKALRTHLKCLGRDIPDWLLQEIEDVAHVPTAGQVVACIYMAMMDAYRIEQENKA